MPQKHLKELLKEEQEPFHLKNYIADKQHILKNQPQKTQIQLKNQKPISKNTSFLCKNVCFFSLHDSPCKSPLCHFSNTPNRVLLHVPTKTASMLLEAAVRIEKHKKPKTQIKNSGFGLLKSVLKRFTHKNRAQKLKNDEPKTGENRGGEISMGIEDENVESVGFSSWSSSTSSVCCCNERQILLELENSNCVMSSNGGGGYDEGFEFDNVVSNSTGDYGDFLNPLSSSHFALCSNFSSDGQSPELTSPVNSPVQQQFENHNVTYNEQKEEEEKEQNSPVSVLDPPFQDDYDYNVHEDDCYGVQCSSYEYVHKAKQHLLHKLQMFEKLAELDTMGLIGNDNNRLILEQVEDYSEYEYESFTFDDKRQVHTIIEDIVNIPGYQCIKKPEFKRLVSDLMIEEGSVENETSEIGEKLIKRVSKRLESWKEVEANTIHMMVEIDLKKEIDDWKKPQEQIAKVALEFEVAICTLLVDELVEDISYHMCLI